MENYNQDKPNILIANDINNSEWAREYTNSGDINDFHHWYLIDDFLSTVEFRDDDYVLMHGEYKGCSIKFLLNNDFSALEKYIMESDMSYLSSSFIAKAIEAGWVFSEEVVLAYKKRLCDYKAALWLCRKREAEQEYHRENNCDEEYN